METINNFENGRKSLSLHEIHFFEDVVLIGTSASLSDAPVWVEISPHLLAEIICKYTELYPTTPHPREVVSVQQEIDDGGHMFDEEHHLERKSQLAESDDYDYEVLRDRVRDEIIAEDEQRSAIGDLSYSSSEIPPVHEESFIKTLVTNAGTRIGETLKKANGGG